VSVAKIKEFITEESESTARGNNKHDETNQNGSNFYKLTSVPEAKTVRGDANAAFLLNYLAPTVREEAESDPIIRNKNGSYSVVNGRSKIRDCINNFEHSII